MDGTQLALADPLFKYLPQNSVRYPLQFDKRSMGQNPMEVSTSQIYIDDQDLEAFKALEGNNATVMCTEHPIKSSLKVTKQYFQVKVRSQAEGATLRLSFGFSLVYDEKATLADIKGMNNMLLKS